MAGRLSPLNTEPQKSLLILAASGKPPSLSYNWSGVSSPQFLPLRGSLGRLGATRSRLGFGKCGFLQGMHRDVSIESVWKVQSRTDPAVQLWGGVKTNPCGSDRTGSSGRDPCSPFSLPLPHLEVCVTRSMLTLSVLLYCVAI